MLDMIGQSLYLAQRRAVKNRCAVCRIRRHRINVKCASSELIAILKEGDVKARDRSESMMKKVKEKIGLGY